MTHGPAIRNRSLAGMQILLFLCGRRFGLVQQRPQTMLSLLDRRGDEGCKKRVWLEGLRFELGVELAAEEPGMVLELANFHIHPVRRVACELEAVIDQDLFVFAIELVTVAV